MFVCVFSVTMET